MEHLNPEDIANELIKTRQKCEAYDYAHERMMEAKSPDVAEEWAKVCRWMINHGWQYNESYKRW